MKRVIFVVDGFNLYHSLLDASKDAGGAGTRWLDLRRLCSSYLSVIGKRAAGRADIERIYYFSAPPTHRSQEKQDHHALYMACLRATDINVELARFKSKDVFCPKCRKPFIAHEEKETDVAIAAKLMEVCHVGEGDIVVLMTGDTDLAPAVRASKRIFPNKLIFFAFPYKRTNRELVEIAPNSFSVKLKSCLKYQLPDPFVTPDGDSLQKPASW